MNSCRRNIRKLAKICFFFLLLVYATFVLSIHFACAPPKCARFSGDTASCCYFIVWKLTNRGTHTAAQQSPWVFFFFFFLRSEKSLNTKRIMEKLVQSDHQRARFSEEVLLLALWGCYGNSQKPKNKAINDFNRSMRKSFFPNEGCCLNPGRSNLNWTKEQTKEGLETCGRINVWLRIVQQLKLTTLKPKLF